MNRVMIGNYRSYLWFVGIVWCIYILHVLLGGQLRVLALQPREVERLYAVFTMHFLHWNFGHLLANTIPLLILGFFVNALGKLKQVTVLIMLISGLLVWLFARNALHAGASGLVMGYWAYLLANAFFQRNLKSILMAIITLLTYGGLIFTLFDFRSSVSFEGHAFGFLAGIVSAWILKNMATG